MKKITKLLALMLFSAMLITSTLPATSAIDIPIDIGSLFDEEEGGTEAGDTEAGTTEQPDNNVNEDFPSMGPEYDNNNDNETTKEDNKTEVKEETKEEEKIYNSKFSDVVEKDWYYSYVTSLASKGIITGYPDGTFAPKGNITRAEFIKLLVECMGYELTNNDVFEDVTKDDAKDWYYTYVSTAADNKIISAEDYGKEFKGDEKITREEVASLIIKATGVETGKYASPYVDTVDEDIVALYTICLMQGTVDDKSGDRYFFPTWNITRAEISAVFTRLLEYNEDKDKFVKEKMVEYGMTELKLLSLPKTAAEYYETVKNAGLTPALSFAIKLDNPTYELAEYHQVGLQNGYLACVWSHPEYFTHFRVAVNQSTDIVNSGYIKFKLESNSEFNSLDTIVNMYNECKKRARDIALKISLNNYGKNKLELAGLVHDYLVENVKYKDIGMDIQFLTYGALFFGEAVCQGYAGAFNMICHELGIDSIAVTNSDHMWNVIKLNGKKYFYDCTWDDKDNGKPAKTTYRGVSSNIIRATHGEYLLFDYAFSD